MKKYYRDITKNSLNEDVVDKKSIILKMDCFT